MWLNLTGPGLAADSQGYSDSGAGDQHLYRYQVCAVTAIGGSACFNGVSANGPSGVGAIDTGSEVALAWSDSSTDETRYLLYREETAAPGFQVVAALPADTTGYRDASAPAGNLRYRLCAANNGVTACGPPVSVAVVR